MQKKLEILIKKLKDKLLNALQINNFKDKSNSDLKEYAIQTIYKQILKTDLINFSKKIKLSIPNYFSLLFLVFNTINSNSKSTYK